MTEADLIEEIARRYKEMPRKKRVATIRKSAAKSAADKRFFRRYFPDLYQEAFRASASSAGGRSANTRRNKPAAKRR